MGTVESFGRRNLLSMLLSISPSVRLPYLFLSSWNSVTTTDSYVRGKGQCHRSKLNVTEVKTNLAQISAFPDVDSNWNDAHGSGGHRRGALLFLNSIRPISMLHGLQNRWWSSLQYHRFDCLMTSLILITMDNGRGHCALWQSCKVINQTTRTFVTQCLHWSPIIMSYAV